MGHELFAVILTILGIARFNCSHDKSVICNLIGMFKIKTLILYDSDHNIMLTGLLSLKTQTHQIKHFPLRITWNLNITNKFNFAPC